MRYVVISICALLLVSACAGPSSPPLISLLDQGAVVDGLQSAYCWDSGLSEICVDPMEPQFETAYAWPAKTPLRLQLDKPLPDSLTLSLSAELFGDEIVSETVSPADTVTWEPAVEPGAYVLSVDASWGQGDVTTWFYVDLK